jgi:hypothetical protein
MRKSSKYECVLFLCLAVLILPAATTVVGADLENQADAHALEEEIPTGFKLDRYASLWERNPFTLVAPSVAEIKRSVFDKLFLTSWLKGGPSDVVFIQDSETNEVQRITTEANKNNLRLIALHLNPIPQLVEAVISDGKEVRPVKFRLEAQVGTAQSVPPVAQMANGSLTSVAPAPSLQAQINLPNAQTSSLPATKSVDQPRRGGSGTPGAQFRGNRRPHGESEALHLPRPGQTSG